MRYDPEHKAKTHKKIVRNASRQLRAKGLNGSAVSTVMKASGLTHGGFYRHFGNRDDLVVEAVETSLEELGDRLIAAAKESKAGEGWKAMVRSYLSLERCDRLDDGCPIASLAPDIARTRPAVKRRSSEAILKFRERILPFMPGKDAEEKATNFLAIITPMVGTIALARTMPDAAIRQRILDRVRDHLLASF